MVWITLPNITIMYVIWRLRVDGANEVNIINHASDCWWEECCWKAPRRCVLTKESWERVHTALVLPHISASKCLNLPNAPHSGEMTRVLACYSRPAGRVWWLFISLEITPMVHTVFKRRYVNIINPNIYNPPWILRIYSGQMKEHN